MSLIVIACTAKVRGQCAHPVAEKCFGKKHPTIVRTSLLWKIRRAVGFVALEDRVLCTNSEWASELVQRKFAQFISHVLGILRNVYRPEELANRGRATLSNLFRKDVEIGPIVEKRV
jgi:hypothetical protein